MRLVNTAALSCKVLLRYFFSWQAVHGTVACVPGVSVMWGNICKFSPSISPGIHFDLFQSCKLHVHRASLLMQFLLLSQKACLEDRIAAAPQ